MRLHQLRIVAFGPFADSVEVDFDQLSEAGLFLLTGPTGAGKSSVLDAVCFGLYGEVPGDRHDAKHLRSDHAAPGATPMVVLEFSVGDRHFQFTRTPAWERPKKRGTGTTRQQASVVAEELRDGQWAALTTRLDDAGLLITELLGMTCTQFTQVALLPQGRFQAFLRATSAERHAVLQRLFRTDRFEQVERWLSDRRRTLHRAERSCQDQVSAIVHRFSEASDEPAPDAWELGDLGPALQAGEIGAWIDAVLRDFAERARSAKLAAERTAIAHAEASAQHQAGVATAAAQRADAEARAELDEFERSEPDHQARVCAVRDHERAATLLPAIARADETRADAERLEARLAEALAFDNAPPASTTAVAERLSAAIREEQRATAALALAEDRDQARSAVRHTEAALAHETDVIEQVEIVLAEVDQAVDQRRTELTAHEEVAAELATRRVQHAEATSALTAARELETAAVDLAAVEAELAQQITQVQMLREAHLDAREARINAMAGELAGQLASGCSCPVCGSIEHPAPARHSGGAGRRREEAAQRAWESADSLRLAAEQSVLAIRARRDRAEVDSAGRTVADWSNDEEVRATALAEAEEASRALAQVRGDLDTAVKSRSDLSEKLAAHQATRTQLATELDRARARAEAAATAYRSALGDFEDVQSRVEHYGELIVRLATARDALTAFHQASALRDQARNALRDAVADAGFDSVASAAAAVMGPEDLSAAQESLARHEEVHARATSVLTSPAVVAARGCAAPDIDALASSLDAARARRADADADHVRAEASLGRLHELTKEATRALAAWQPVHDQYVVAERLSTITEGTSTQNALKMRLSAYVLAERLRQVVAAANERLVSMTDQRYALEQMDERAVGAQRGGLSLRVRDDWTGIRRDPTTLSGGETFVVSLALALGLADTVAHEAGGASIDTLFIDEGFGSLDETTLDDVMDTLDGLRHNGRVVGVVSHVAEMRERIPAGVEVRKARTGSTLTVRGDLVAGASRR